MKQQFDDDGWIVRPQPRPAARMRLFCFPYAGGGGGVYRPWTHVLPETIEVCVVRGPGREERIAEAPITDFRTLVARATAAVVPLLDRPYAIFGHSLGAIVGFEVARALASPARRRPLVFMPSGRRAPNAPSFRAPISDLPDDAFLAEIARSSGPDPAFEEFLRHPELVDLFMPVLRADFSLAETYRPLSERTLQCPILALASRDDAQANETSLAAWRDETSGPFAMQYFPGGHLYLNQHREPLLAVVLRELEERLATDPSGGEALTS